MTFEEWWATVKPKDMILYHSVANTVWHAAQEAMRERATIALHRIAEEMNNDDYHGAAEVVRALGVE